MMCQTGDAGVIVGIPGGCQVYGCPHETKCSILSFNVQENKEQLVGKVVVVSPSAESKKGWKLVGLGILEISRDSRSDLRFPGRPLPLLLLLLSTP